MMASRQASTCFSDISAACIPVLDNLGIRGGKSHTPDEFIYLNAMEPCAKQLAAIIYNI